MEKNYEKELKEIMKEVLKDISKEELAQCNIYADGTFYVFDLAIEKGLASAKDIHELLHEYVSDTMRKQSEIFSLETKIHAASLKAASEIYANENWSDDADEIASALSIEEIRKEVK